MKGSYVLRYLKDRNLLLESGQILVLKGFSSYSLSILKREIPRLEIKTGQIVWFGLTELGYITYEEYEKLNKDSLKKECISQNIQILLLNNVIPYEEIQLCANIVLSNPLYEEGSREASLIEYQIFDLLGSLINTNPISEFPQVNFVDPFSIPYKDFATCDPNISIRSENEYVVKLPSKSIEDVIFSMTKNGAKEEFCKEKLLSYEQYSNQISVSLISTNSSRIFNMIINKILFLLDLKTLLEQNKTEDVENKKSILTAKLSRELEDLKREKDTILEEFPTSNTTTQNRLKFVNLRIELIENEYSKEFKNLFLIERDELILIEEALEYLFMVAREYLPGLRLSVEDFHPHRKFPTDNMVTNSQHIDIYKGLKNFIQKEHC